MLSKIVPRGPPGPPRGSKEGPKTHGLAKEPQEDPRSFKHVPKRALRWPQEACKMLRERTIEKVLILTPVVVAVVVVVVFVVVVVVIAVVFLVVVPCVLPCSSREHRPTTLDDQCTSQRWLF